MKLYELNCGDRFTLSEAPKIPPDAAEGDKGAVYKYSHVDGMYAPVHDPEGHLSFFAAWTEVEIVQ